MSALGGATLPTGDADAGRGMGHVMVAGGATARVHGARLGADATVTYARALGDGAEHAAHAHGASLWPLIDPMGAEEITVELGGAAAIGPRGLAVRASGLFGQPISHGAQRQIATGGVSYGRGRYPGRRDPQRAGGKRGVHHPRPAHAGLPLLERPVPKGLAMRPRCALTLLAAVACGGAESTRQRRRAAARDNHRRPHARRRQLAEGVLTGGPANRADLHLAAATAAIDWNIHGHAGSGTQNVAEGYAQRAVDYAFVPAADGEWFVLVRNASAAPLAVAVQLELYGAMTWSGWQ